LVARYSEDLCGPLRISAYSASKHLFNAEIAEVRRGFGSQQSNSLLWIRKLSTQQFDGGS